MVDKVLKSKTPKCPSGYIIREGYKTKTGKEVPARCIKKTGIFPGKAEVKARQLVSTLKAEHKNALKMAKQVCKKQGCKIPTKCPTGKILRASYVREGYKRKSGTKISATIVTQSCIKNRGAIGKGPKKITLNPANHLLSNHGYENTKDLNLTQRHKALEKTINAVGKEHGERNGYIYVIRALRARANLTIKTQPETSKIFADDQKWVSNLYQKYKNAHGLK